MRFSGASLPSFSSAAQHGFLRRNVLVFYFGSQFQVAFAFSALVLNWNSSSFCLQF
jgi:hypothetical protein